MRRDISSGPCLSELSRDVSLLLHWAPRTVRGCSWFTVDSRYRAVVPPSAQAPDWPRCGCPNAASEASGVFLHAGLLKGCADCGSGGHEVGCQPFIFSVPADLYPAGSRRFMLASQTPTSAFSHAPSLSHINGTGDPLVRCSVANSDQSSICYQPLLAGPVP